MKRLGFLLLIVLLTLSAVSCATSAVPSSGGTTAGSSPGEMPAIAAITDVKSANDALVKAQAVRVFARDSVALYYVNNGPDRDKVRDTFRSIDARFTSTYTALRRLADLISPETIEQFRAEYSNLRGLVTELRDVVPKKKE